MLSSLFFIAGRNSVDVTFEQRSDHILLSLLPSKFDSTVICECRGCEVVVVSKHREQKGDEEVEKETRRTVTLPFVVGESQVKPAGSNRCSPLSPLGNLLAVHSLFNYLIL